MVTATEDRVEVMIKEMRERQTEAARRAIMKLRRAIAEAEWIEEHETDGVALDNAMKTYVKAHEMIKWILFRYPEARDALRKEVPCADTRKTQEL